MKNIDDKNEEIVGASQENYSRKREREREEKKKVQEIRNINDKIKTK